MNALQLRIAGAVARIPKRAARRADPERALRDAAVEEDDTDPVGAGAPP